MCISRCTGMMTAARLSLHSKPAAIDPGNREKRIAGLVGTQAPSVPCVHALRLEDSALPAGSIRHYAAYRMIRIQRHPKRSPIAARCGRAVRMVVLQRVQSSPP
jgi:hypothetical protein